MTTPAPWRETFLRLALAVAEGLPTPTLLSCYDDKTLHVRLATVAELEAWVAVGKLDDRWIDSDNNTPMVRLHYMGWKAILTTNEPVVTIQPDELGAEVAATITAALDLDDPSWTAQAAGGAA